MMNFKEFIKEEHPDPDTLLFDNFEQMCLLAENYAEYRTFTKRRRK
jgi:hypothetical protein